MIKNHYHTLGLQNCAPLDKVKRAYRSMALRHHPDRGGDSQKMVEVNEAFEFLCKNKEQYDAALRPARPTPPNEGFTIIVGGFGWTSASGATSTTSASMAF